MMMTFAIIAALWSFELKLLSLVFKLATKLFFKDLCLLKSVK